MHARVTRGQSPPDRIDDAITGWSQYQQEVTVNQEGFRGNMLLVNREAGEWQIVGLWDSLDNINATTAPQGNAQGLVDRGEILAIPTIEIFEVAAANPDPKR